jgi:hypothetical protein
MQTVPFVKAVIEGRFSKLRKEPAGNGVMVKDTAVLFYETVHPAGEDQYALFLMPLHRNVRDRCNNFKAVLMPYGAWECYCSGTLRNGWFAANPMGIMSDTFRRLDTGLAASMYQLPLPAQSLAMSTFRSMVAAEKNVNWRILMVVQCVSHVLRAVDLQVQSWVAALPKNLNASEQMVYVHSRLEACFTARQNEIPFGSGPVCKEKVFVANRLVYETIVRFYSRAHDASSVGDDTWWAIQNLLGAAVESTGPEYPAISQLPVSDCRAQPGACAARCGTNMRQQSKASYRVHQPVQEP